MRSADASWRISVSITLSKPKSTGQALPGESARIRMFRGPSNQHSEDNSALPVGRHEKYSEHQGRSGQPESARPNGSGAGDVAGLQAGGAADGSEHADP